MEAQFKSPDLNAAEKKESLDRLKERIEDFTERTGCGDSRWNQRLSRLSLSIQHLENLLPGLREDNRPRRADYEAIPDDNLAEIERHRDQSQSFRETMCQGRPSSLEADSSDSDEEEGIIGGIRRPLPSSRHGGR